jgi:hypothetical protein
MTTRTNSILLLPLYLACHTATALAQPSWGQVNPATTPLARSSPSMAYDAARRQVVLFGGETNGGQQLNDTWVWDGSNWTQKFPAISPPPRFLACVTYDVAHSQIVLFGGSFGNGGVLGDTWVWDGSNWTQKFPANSPSARASSAMAYDDQFQLAVLFGGYTATGIAGDTWTWDGTNWQHIFPSTNPPARFEHMMAYDALHQQIVMYGGENNLRDTWIWSDYNWTLNPGSSIGNVFTSTMAYDAALQEIIVFGGSVNLNPSNQTFYWDGQTWGSLQPGVSPAARWESAMAYDSNHQQLVLFSGYTGQNFLDDTWVYPATSTSTVSLSASLNPSIYGQPVTLTAAVPTTATGTVTFYDGTTILGISKVTAGSAQLTTTTLLPGSTPLSAHYNGDPAHTTGSTNLPHTVNSVPSSSFIPASAPLITGAGTFAIAMADFNGDGHLDLAVANAANANVTILFGTGSGTFAHLLTNPIPTGNGPFSLAAGDFNNDGHPDLAVANLADNTVTILIGTGDGQFAPGAIVPTGQSPISIAVADFNGDGNADLAVANAGENTVSILLGDGAGHFAPASRIVQDGNPTAVAIGDFNGDGIPDLAVTQINADGGLSGVRVFLGSPNAVFGLPGPLYVTGNFAVALAIGDFNHDGFSDLAVANLADNTITTLLNRGTEGSLIRGPNTPNPAGSSPEYLALGDFNGDGNIDLAIVDSDSNSLTVLLGDGAGNFAPAPYSPLATGPTPFGVAIGDFNGDGRADFAIANFGGNTVSILLGH